MNNEKESMCCRRRAVLLFLLGVVLWALHMASISYFPFISTVLMIAAYSSVCVGGVFLRSYHIRRAGVQGEQISESLLRELPAEYEVLSGVCLDVKGKRCEIDHLVISTRGIVIVETKNYSGMISGNEEDGEWIKIKKSKKGNVYRKIIRNPLYQLRREIYILSRFLHDHDCHCHIDGFVYMLQAECLVENEAIISDADTLLKKVQHSGRAHTLREKQVQEIKKMFCGLRSGE